MSGQGLVLRTCRASCMSQDLVPSGADLDE